MRIVVYGRPAPQGSKKPMGGYTSKITGKWTPRMVEQSAYVAPWREAVKDAALRVRAASGSLLPALDGPLLGSIVFTIERPKKPRFPHPATAPDLSKLLRSTEDALKDAGAISDDSRIVRYRDLAKVFVGDPEALDAPGCVIEIEAMELTPAVKSRAKAAIAQPQLFPLIPAQARDPF